MVRERLEIAIDGVEGVRSKGGRDCEAKRVSEEQKREHNLSTY